MMKLTLLGTGGPRPDLDRHGPAAMLQIGDEYLLFDAGRGVVRQIVRAGVPLERVNPVFITHQHYDHIGDLADVILSSWLLGRRHTLQIFGPPGTTSIVTALLGQVYDKDIEFRAKGEPVLGGWQPVESADVMRGLVHDGGTWKVFTDVVIHGHGLNLPDAFKHRWVCLGYRVEAEGKVIAISGDGVASAGLDRLARDADVLLQCCYLARSEITTPYLKHLAKYTLACADTVGKIAHKARVKKLVLTHFRQKPETVMREVATDVAGDYDGPVVLGRDLTEVLV
jgi:ribonuclease BN (tRNA processing enzyme)